MPLAHGTICPVRQSNKAFVLRVSSPAPDGVPGTSAAPRCRALTEVGSTCLGTPPPCTAEAHHDGSWAFCSPGRALHQAAVGAAANRSSCRAVKVRRECPVFASTAATAPPGHPVSLSRPPRPQSRGRQFRPSTGSTSTSSFTVYAPPVFPSGSPSRLVFFPANRVHRPASAISKGTMASSRIPPTSYTQRIIGPLFPRLLALDPEPAARRPADPRTSIASASLPPSQATVI